MDEKSINGRLSTLKRLKSEILKLIEEETDSLKEFEGLISEKGIVKTYDKENIYKKPKVIEKINNLNSVDQGCVEIDIKGMSVKEKGEYLNKRKIISNTAFFKNLENKINSMPESNGTRYFEKSNINIGIIADEFLYNSLKDAANFIYITPENYKEHIETLDLFFVATAWSGLNKEWVGMSNRNSKARLKIIEIINAYKFNNIKVVFYSKEDPVHYDMYVDLACECDYIFTTEKSIIDNYKIDCNNDNVSVLNFGINPIYHNPIGIRKYEKENEIFFSGSWYNKYPERNDDAIKIFNGVLYAGRKLRLVDRNYELENFKYFFPEEYLEYVVPSVKHDKLQKLHKLYNWSINLNTIKYSQSMYANRIYELQALGNIILSNYSIGVNNSFPNVFLINNKEEVKDILNGFSKEEVYKHQILGIRRVMSQETSYDRVKFICNKVDINFENRNKSVAVIVKYKSKNIKDMFNRQSYENKTLILENELSEERKKEYDIIGFFNEDRLYGRYYIEDMINAFKYTNSDFVTKDGYYSGDKLVDGIEHDFVNMMNDKYRSIFWAKSFKATELLNYKGKQRLNNGYSVDHFEYNEVNSNKKEVENKNYELSVIIAVYNNGDHLLSKCFNSLKRSSMFNSMEIIIVDDGSTDRSTTDIIKCIYENNSNVKTYLFDVGGSGSASRPRNKGFELSTSPYITYLDPDNEAVNDGYYRLYKESNGGNYDMICGNMLKLEKTISKFDFYNKVLENNEQKDVLSSDKKKFISESNFFSMSIQALILKRGVIENNSLKMIEGVFGEDTIFFFELLVNSQKIKVIDTDIHLYYAAVEGSSVNNINSRFFEKYVELEKVRIRKYTDMDLMEDYIEKRFNLYIIGWYFKKLKLVSVEERASAIKCIEEILDLYNNIMDFNITSIKRFYKLCKAKEYDVLINEYINT